MWKHARTCTMCNHTTSQTYTQYALSGIFSQVLLALGMNLGSSLSSSICSRSNHRYWQLPFVHQWVCAYILCACTRVRMCVDELCVRVHPRVLAPQCVRILLCVCCVFMYMYNMHLHQNPPPSDKSKGKKEPDRPIFSGLTPCCKWCATTSGAI